MAGQKVTVIYELVDRISRKADSVRKSLDRLEDQAKDLDKSVKKLNETQGKDLVRAFNQAAKAYDDQLKTLKKLDGQINEVNKRIAIEEKLIRSNTDAAKANRAELERLRKTVIRMTDDHRRLTGELGRYDDALNSAQRRLVDYDRSFGSTAGSIDAFRRGIRGAHGDVEGLTGAMRRFVNGRGEIRSAFRDTMDFSFFRAGVVQGLQMFETFTKILGVLPLIGVALGGLAQMVGALGTGILQVAGSVGRLAGALAIFPGLFAAIGAGMIGFQSIMGTFVSPALKGTKQLEGIDKQIADTQARIKKANEEASKAAEMATIGESTRATASGALGAKADQKAALDRQKEAQQDLNDLMKERAEIAKTLPPLAAELVAKIEDVKDAWRELWFGKNGERALVIMQTLIDNLTAVEEFIKSSQIDYLVATYTRMFVDFSKTFQDTLGDESFRNKFMQVFHDVQHNMERVFQLFIAIMPYAFELADAINDFTKWSLEGILHWVQFKDVFDKTGKKVGEVRRDVTDVAAFGEKIDAYFGRVKNSVIAWGFALKNILKGFQTLLSVQLGPGSIVDIFEMGLMKNSVGFAKWAQNMKDTGKAAQFFVSSLRILRAMGGVIKSIFGAIGAVLGNKEATDATVGFLVRLAGGFELLGRFMTDSLVVNGPKLNKFFDELGVFFSDNMDNIVVGTGLLIDMFTKFFAFSNKFNALTGFLIELRLAMLGIGLIAGQLLSPLARFAGIALKVAEAATLMGKGPLANVIKNQGKTAEEAFNPSKRAVRDQQAAKAAKKVADNNLRAAQTENKRALASLSRMENIAETAIDGTKADKELSKAQDRVIASEERLAKAQTEHAKAKGKLIDANTKLTTSAKKGVSAFGKYLGILGKVAFWVGIVIGAFDAWRENFLGVRDDAKKIVDSVQDKLLPALKDLGDALSGKGTGTGGILEFLELVSKVVGGSVLKVLLTSLQAIVDGLTMVVKFLTPIAEVFSEIFDHISGILKADSLGEAGENFASLMQDIAIQFPMALAEGLISAAQAFSQEMAAIMIGLGLGTAAGRGAIRGLPGAGRAIAGGVAGAAGWAKGARAGGRAGAKAAAGAAGRGAGRMAVRGGAKLLGLGGGPLGFIATTLAVEGLFMAYDKFFGGEAAKGIAQLDFSRSKVVSENTRRMVQDMEDFSVSNQQGIDNILNLTDSIMGDRDRLKSKLDQLRRDKEKMPGDVELYFRWLTGESTAGIQLDKADLDKEIKKVEGQIKGIEKSLADMLAEVDPRIAAIMATDASIKTKLGLVEDLLYEDKLTMQAEMDRQLTQQKIIEQMYPEIKATNDLQRQQENAMNIMIARQQQIDSLRSMDTSRMNPRLARRHYDRIAELERIQRAAQRNYLGREGGEDNLSTGVQASVESSTLAGYTGTTGKGAVLKFDPDALGAFKQAMADVRKAFANMQTVSRRVIRNMGTMLENAAKPESAIVSGARALAEAIMEPFEEIFGLPNGRLHTYLQTALTDVANIINSTGGSPLGAIPGFNTTPTGGGQTATAQGDSPAPPTTAAGGGMASFGNSGPGMGGLYGLNESIREQAAALLSAYPGMETITSTLRSPAENAAAGGSPNSQHLTGMAMDVVPAGGSKDAMNAMGRWAQTQGVAFGVNPSQVFYPANDAGHQDHVHIGFGGAVGALPGLLGMNPVTAPPNFGDTLAGGIAKGLADTAYNALTDFTSSLTGGGMMLGGGGGENMNLNQASPEAAKMYARGQLAAFGWGPDQFAPLDRLWTSESNWRWNALNSSNHPALAGLPITAQARPYGIPQSFPGSKMASEGPDWLTNAATQIDWGLKYIKQNYGSPSNVPLGGYGNGGHFRVNRPTPIVVGDKQPEEITVNPVRGPNRGEFKAGGTTVVNSTVNLGTIIANDEGIQQLTEAIGTQFHKDLRQARLEATSKGEQ